jgi:hypothetical protein
MIVAFFLSLFALSLFCSQLNGRKQGFVSLADGLMPLMTIEICGFHDALSVLSVMLCLDVAIRPGVCALAASQH